MSDIDFAWADVRPLSLLQLERELSLNLLVFGQMLAPESHPSVPEREKSRRAFGRFAASLLQLTHHVSVLDLPTE